MANQDSPGGPLHRETAALHRELEQARAALTRAQAEIAMLSRQRSSRPGSHSRTPDDSRAGPARHAGPPCERGEDVPAGSAQAQAELFRMQKLDALGQLTSGIAHDFNNLLTVIINGLQLLGQVADLERRSRILRRTEDAAWRGATLTQRLLAFARRQPLQPERIDLGRQIEGLRALLTHGLRGNISLRTDFDGDLWPVEVDITGLELALLNLTVNARDAMPDGGVLILAARNVPLAAERARRLGLPAGDFVELGIADSGTGIPPELLPKVFEPFFTTKAEGKGTGLGLPQVQEFARQSGGAAWVESAPGQGTTVRLLLPRCCSAAAMPPVQAQPPAAAVRYGDRLKILVVEDDDIVAAMVLDILTEFGHSGTRVGTMASALAVLNGAEQVDLVFSDVLLPGGGSGLDLAREMASRQIDVPVILTSGYGAGMTQRLAAAKVQFLRKPYRPDTLRRAIDEALAAAPQR